MRHSLSCPADRQTDKRTKAIHNILDGRRPNNNNTNICKAHIVRIWADYETSAVARMVDGCFVNMWRWSRKCLVSRTILLTERNLSIRVRCASPVGSLAARTRAVVTTATRPPLYSHSTAIRPRYDHSTTYVTIVGLRVWGLLHCGLNK